MVLHNDKWKYKAKKAYQRKHNLDKNNKPKDLPPSDEDSDSLEYDSNGDAINDEEENNEVVQDETEIMGNSWRFLDPEQQNPDLLRDPEYVAKLERERLLESEKNQHYNDIVNSKLKENGGAMNIKELESKYTLNNGKKSLKKIKDEDILHLKFNNESDDENNYDSDVEGGYYTKKSPEIREFSEEEKEKFLKLQKIIDHKKRVEEMRKLVNRNKPTRGNIHEIKTSVESDNYKTLIDKQLKESLVSQNNKFEDLVEDLLGVDLNDVADNSKKEINHSDRIQKGEFDLDSVLGGIGSTNVKESSKNSNSAKKNSVKVNLQDDFLDSIL